MHISRSNRCSRGHGKEIQTRLFGGYAKLEQIYTKADVIFFGEEEEQLKPIQTQEEEAAKKYLDELGKASAFCMQAIQEFEEQELAEKQSELWKKWVTKFLIN